MGCADLEVVHPASPAQRDRALPVGDVVVQPEVAGCAANDGMRLGRRPVGLARGDPSGRAVWPVLVVPDAEGVELGLQLGDRAGRRLLSEPALERLVAALHPYVVLSRASGTDGAAAGEPNAMAALRCATRPAGRMVLGRECQRSPATGQPVSDEPGKASDCRTRGDGSIARSASALGAGFNAPLRHISPGTEHPGAEPLPGPRAVERVVGAPVGLPSVLRAAATRAAGDDTAARAQLHPQIVRGLGGLVYTPAVLRLRDDGGPNPQEIRRRACLVRPPRLRRAPAPTPRECHGRTRRR
jgi:hypothetical protein